MAHVILFRDSAGWVAKFIRSTRTVAQHWARAYGGTVQWPGVWHGQH